MLMYAEDRRKYERVETNVKLKLSGDAAWTECTTADCTNVSGGGLSFIYAGQVSVGDCITLQFILHTKSGAASNIHFLASARVVRVTPKNDLYQVAVEFLIDENIRKELLNVIKMIKSDNLKITRPTNNETLFGNNRAA